MNLNITRHTDRQGYNTQNGGTAGRGLLWSVIILWKHCRV